MSNLEQQTEQDLHKKEEEEIKQLINEDKIAGAQTLGFPGTEELVKHPWDEKEVPKS